MFIFYFLVFIHKNKQFLIYQLSKSLNSLKSQLSICYKELIQAQVQGKYKNQAKYQIMRQKRQTYQKEIRRKAIDNIFRQNRQKHFKYNFQKSLNTQKVNQANLQTITHCTNEFARFSQEIHESIVEQNFENLMALVKDSFYELKRLLIKSKQSSYVIGKIIQMWFKYSLDQLLISSVKIFEKINQKSFGAVRKQIYKYAISHFHAIFQYRSVFENRINSRQMFNFLFLALNELCNLPDSIQEILGVINCMINYDKSARYEFIFQNKKIQEKEEKLLTFENVCYVMFQNKDKFYSGNMNQQEGKYREIKMIFIELFKQCGYQLQQMKKYIQNCKEAALKNTKSSAAVLDQTYQTTLKLYGYPSQVVLKQFFQKSILAIILQTINGMRQFYLSHWIQSQQNQDNLADCLQAFRLLIDFYPSYKIITSFQDQLEQFIGLILISNLNIQVKNQTIFLLDSIIYVDEKGDLTNMLITNHNLFDKIWSYNEPTITHVKLNIINNLLLYTSGFHAVDRQLCEIVIFLNRTQKFVSQALTFIHNYFAFIQYDLSKTSRINLITDLLYSLPGNKFTMKDLENDIYILTHLYDNGFTRQLPLRYHQSCEQSILNSEKKPLEIQENDQKIDLCYKMIDIYNNYRKQSNYQNDFMQDQ